MSRENQWRTELAHAVRGMDNQERFTVNVEPTDPHPFLVLSQNTFPAVSVKHTHDTDKVRLKADLDDSLYITTDKEMEFSFLGVQFKGKVTGTGVKDGHTVIDIEPCDVRPPDGGWDE